MNDASPVAKLTAKDYASDQEVRWCPGCGDYAIVRAVQRAVIVKAVEQEFDLSAEQITDDMIPDVAKQPEVMQAAADAGAVGLDHRQHRTHRDCRIEGVAALREHLVPGLVEDETHDFAEAVVVVDHQDASHVPS